MTKVELRGGGERLVLIPTTTASGKDKAMSGHPPVGQDYVDVTVCEFVCRVVDEVWGVCE